MTTPLQHTSLGELGYTPLLASSLGELGSTTIAIVPGGGLTDAVDYRMRNLRKRTQRNIRNLLLLSSLFVVIKEEEYDRRQEEREADGSD